MKQNQKRDVTVLTDDVNKTKELLDEKLSSSCFIENIQYMRLVNSCFLPSESTNVNIAFINDIHNLSHSLLINVIKLIHDEIISVIYTDDIDEYRSCFENMIDDKEDNKHAPCIDGYVDAVLKIFEPINHNINIAFITDNETYIKILFGRLIKLVEERNKLDDEINVESNYTPTNIPIDSFMPELIQGWIYSTWYGKKHNKPKPNINTEETTNAMVKSLISVRINEITTYTYHWIKPSHETDLSGCGGHFDSIFFDVTSFYASVVFKEYMELIPFTSTPLDELIDKAGSSWDYSTILNVVKNISTYIRKNEFTAKVIGYKDNYSLNLNSVRGPKSGLSFTDILEITHIDPFQ